MTRSHMTGEPRCEWAAVQAPDALTPEEKAAYDKHLQKGCPVCGLDPRAFREAAQQLGFRVTPVSPPSSLRERLLRRIENLEATSAVDSPTEVVESKTIRIPARWAGLWPWSRQARLAWLPVAAVILVACLGGWATLSVWKGSPALSPAGEEAYIDSLFARVTSIIRVGLGDHIHCTVFRKFPKAPPSDQQMAEEMGPDYAGVLYLVKERVPDDYTILLGHRCLYRERKFVHLALKSDTALLSVIITRKQQGESFSQGTLFPIVNQAGVPIYRAGVDEFEVAGFESEEHLVYVISDLTQDDNLRLTANLAPELHEFLSERKG